MCNKCLAAVFLSRLCGGERKVVVDGFGLNFLSRLCGGEPFFYLQLTAEQFLSRLCGGELLLA